MSERDTPETGRALAIASLVLGVAGIPACLTLIVPLAAVITGRVAASRDRGNRLAAWGTGLGIAGLALGAIIVALVGLSPFGIQGLEAVFDWTP